jgi:hypothetical protein
MPGEADMIPAARISRLKGGKIYATHVLMRYGEPVDQATAIEKARAGKTVFVSRSDVHQVLDALGVNDADTRR